MLELKVDVTSVGNSIRKGAESAHTGGELPVASQ